MSAPNDDGSAIAPPANKAEQSDPMTIQTEKLSSEEIAAPDSEPPTPVAKPEPRLCGICNKGVGKYKCPRCPLAYCSVACNKIHKENHPPPPPPSEQPQPQQPTPTTTQNSHQKPDPYQVLLQHRSSFDRLFLKYPGLESVLLDIQNRTLPPPDNNSTYSPKPFNNGGGGFNINNNNRPPKQPQIWTGEVGLRRGAAALRKARTDPGNHGDGVREFCEMVMYLLSKPASEGSQDAPNVTSLVREEVVEDQVKVIEQLNLLEGAGEDLL